MIKSRLLAEYQSRQQAVESNQQRIRPEFEILRRQTRENAEPTFHPKPKEFSFGLGLRQPAPVPLAKPEKHASGSLIDAIAGMNESLEPRITEIPLVEDKLEINSIASKASLLGRHLESPSDQISFISDLSPMTRQLCNLRTSEEVNVLTSTNPSAEEQLLRNFLINNFEVFEEENFDNDDVAQFIMGRIPRAKLGAKLYKAQGPLMENLRSEITSESQLENFQNRAESIEETDNENASISNDGSLEVEERIVDYYENLRQSSPDPDRRSSLALAQAVNRLDTESLSDRQKLKTKLLFQFVKEYKKLKEEKQKHTPQRLTATARKPRVPTTARLLQKKTSEATIDIDPSIYYYASNDQSPKQETVQTSHMREGWQTGKPVKHTTPTTKARLKPATNSKVSPPIGYKVNQRTTRHTEATYSSNGRQRPAIQEKQSKRDKGWIGGNSYSEELDDENWISVDN